MERITPELAKELKLLLEYHPAKRLSRGLRCLFMEFLSYGHDLPVYFEDLVYDLDALFCFLDVAERGIEGRSVTSI